MTSECDKIYSIWFSDLSLYWHISISVCTASPAAIFTLLEEPAGRDVAYERFNLNSRDGRKKRHPASSSSLLILILAFASLFIGGLIGYYPKVRNAELNYLTIQCAIPPVAGQAATKA